MDGNVGCPSAPSILTVPFPLSVSLPAGPIGVPGFRLFSASVTLAHALAKTRDALERHGINWRSTDVDPTLAPEPPTAPWTPIVFHDMYCGD
jgi:hypothetical protein